MQNCIANGRAVFHAPVRSDERARERHVICMIPRCISDWLMNRSELARSRPRRTACPRKPKRNDAARPAAPPSNLIVRAVSPPSRLRGEGGISFVSRSLPAARFRERERERERADSSGSGGRGINSGADAARARPRTKRDRDKKARNAFVPARRRILDLAGGSSSASKKRGQRDLLN